MKGIRRGWLLGSRFGFGELGSEDVGWGWGNEDEDWESCFLCLEALRWVEMEGWEGISARVRGMRRIRLPRGILRW